MNAIDKQFFQKLYEDRAQSADTFEKPSTRQMWHSIVEKYSDQAHFVYELIQNADDAGATYARFILEKDKLVFAHNGKRHFSISNPETEDIDSQNGKLGDINSITGIAFSTKKEMDNKIGKFGVGFKAVFQYTSSPRIYDSNIKFRIDRYIVPSEIEEDFKGRKADETLFVFPFDNKDRIPEETYNDIKRKLQDLSYPLLFLSNLTQISYIVGTTIGTYRKIVNETKKRKNVNAERISLIKSINKKKTIDEMWLFTKEYNNLKYSVGFFMKDGKLIPVDEPAYCFFPTRENTNLNFLIHAPFLLTDSREGIRAGIPHNDTLVSMLAELAADSILFLRDIGNRMIDDSIFSIIPIDHSKFIESETTKQISFKAFYDNIKNIFLNEKILPTRKGYTTTENAYWASVKTINQLFDDNQLKQLSRNDKAEWVFVTYGRDALQSNNRMLFNYLNSLLPKFHDINEDDILDNEEYFDNDSICYCITKEFIVKQDISWLKIAIATCNNLQKNYNLWYNIVHSVSVIAVFLWREGRSLERKRRV